MVTVLAVAATVLTGCAHTPTVRPAQIVFACGDGNFYATGLHWSHWGTKDAEASGIGHANDCTPNCAAGRFHTYPLHVRLTRPVVCVHGRREFSRWAWTYTGMHPAYAKRSDGEVLPCSFLKLKP